MKKLTDKEEKFCNEYVIDFNGTQAALRAGYSQKNSRFTAARMLAKANITKTIYDLKIKQLKHIKVNRQFVIDGLLRIAQSSNENVAKSALDSLGKHVGLFEIDNAQKSQSVSFHMKLADE